MTRTGDRARRALRRRVLRRARDSWARFVRDIHGDRPPYGLMSSARWRLFIARLASRCINWTGSGRWWKDQLRRERRRNETKALRIDLEQAVAELAPTPVPRRSRRDKNES
jgi:hypothetical protein